MKELQDIMAAWKQLEPEQTAALATLVKVEGSADRRLGARMLITSDGQQVRTISGGCLESDVVKRSPTILIFSKNISINIVDESVNKATV